MEGSTSAFKKRVTLLHPHRRAVALWIGRRDLSHDRTHHRTKRSLHTIIAYCSEVLSSSYAVVAGYPLASIGALAYFSIFSLAILALFGYQNRGPVVVAAGRGDVPGEYVVDLFAGVCDSCFLSVLFVFSSGDICPNRFDCFCLADAARVGNDPTRLDRLSSLRILPCKVSFNTTD